MGEDADFEIGFGTSESPIEGEFGALQGLAINDFRSILGGGAGGGNNSSKVSKKSKVATGNLVRGRYK